MKNRFFKVIATCLVLVMTLGLFSFVYSEPSKVVKGEASGMSVKLYGSNLGTLGIFKDANYYGVTRTSDGRFNISDAYEQFLRLSNRSELKRIRLEGFVEPVYSEKYSFTTNKTTGKNTQIWIDDNIVFDKGKSYDIALKKGESYHIVIEVKNESYDEFKLYWESESQAIEIVPETSLFVPSSYSRSIIEQYNPNGDIDNDGIPNSWETNGYCVLDYGIIVPYDESLNLRKYVTDFDEKSTDLDPYTDFEEVTGIGMDRSVLKPGNDPNVPAYPEVSFVTTGVKIIRNETNTTGQSISSSNSTQNVAGVVDMNSRGTGTKENAFNNVNAGVTAKYEAAGHEVKATVTVSVDSKFGQGKTDTTHIEDATDNIDKTVVGSGGSTGEDESTTVDTANFAQLVISGYYLNHGTAPIYNLDPVVSLTIGSKDYQVTVDSKVLKTFEVVDGQRPTVIAPKSKYPINGELVLDLTGTSEGALPGAIMLTKEQTELIESGVPFGVTISINKGDVKKIVDPEDNGGNYFKNIGTWNTYLNDIKNNSAVVSLKIPGSAKVSRRMFTGGQSRPTLLEALELLYDAEYKNGKLYIEGQKLSFEEWQFDFRGQNNTVNNIVKALKNDSKIDFNSIRLEDNMEVTITKSDTEAMPLVLSSYFDPVNEKFHVVVIPTGNNPIDKIEAEISAGGKEKTITLSKDSQSEFNYISDSVTDLDIGYSNKLYARAENGVTTIKDISVDENYLKSQVRKGLGFITADEMGVTENKQKLIDFKTASAWKALIDSHPEWLQFTVRKGNEGLGVKYDIYDLNTDGRLNASEILNIRYADRVSTYPNGLIGELNQNKVTLATSFTYMHARYSYVNVAYYNGSYPNYIKGFTSDNRYVTQGLPSKTNNNRGGFFDVYQPGNINAIQRYFVYGAGWYNLGDDVISEVELYSNGEKIQDKVGIAVRSGKVDLRAAMPEMDNVKLKAIRMYKTDTDVTMATVIERDMMLEYLDNLISGRVYERMLSLDGAFALDSDKVFVRTSQQNVVLSSGTKSIIAPNKDATSVLYTVTGHNNGSRIGNHKFNLDTWDDTRDNRSEDIEDLLFVPKNDNEASISTDIKNSTTVGTIGYFIDRNNVTTNNFWQYWIPSKPLRYTLMPDYRNGRNSVTWTIDYNHLKVKGYPVRPKGFIIKVTQDAELKKLEVTVNGQLHKLNISSDSKVKKGNLIYVDANSSNPFNLTVDQNIGGEHLSGNYQFGDVQYEIVGYFYDSNI